MPTRRSAAVLTRPRIRARVVAAAVVVAAALVALAFLAGRSVVDDDSGRDATRPPAATPPGDPASPAGIDTTPSGFERFVYAPAGVSVAYPRTWERLEPDDQGVALLVAAPPRRRTSLLMRVLQLDLDADITVQTLPVVQPLTERLVRRGRGVRLLERPQAVEVGGLPGWRYRYSFEDARGARGAHVHYFLFKTGGRMITLVLQALPAERLAGLTPLFESVAGTFRGGSG